MKKKKKCHDFHYSTDRWPVSLKNFGVIKSTLLTVGVRNADHVCHKTFCFLYNEIYIVK